MGSLWCLAGTPGSLPVRGGCLAGIPGGCSRCNAWWVDCSPGALVWVVVGWRALSVVWLDVGARFLWVDCSPALSRRFGSLVAPGAVSSFPARGVL